MRNGALLTHLKNTEDDLEDALWKLEDYETSRSQLEKIIIDLKDSGKLQSSVEVAEKMKVIAILEKRNAQLNENLQILDRRHTQTIIAIKEENKANKKAILKNNGELCEQLEAQRQAMESHVAETNSEIDMYREGQETRTKEMISLETRNAELCEELEAQRQAMASHVAETNSEMKRDREGQETRTKEMTSLEKIGRAHV